jgi:hypothetical protein
MMDLKTAIEKNKVEEYLSTVPIINFIKDYDKLSDDEMRKFISINSERINRNVLSFNINSENIPPYPNF